MAERWRQMQSVYKWAEGRPGVKDCLFPQKTKSEGLSLPLKEVNKAVGTTRAFQLSLILKAVPLHLCWVAL